ncbi:phosphoribosyltransferase [Actinocrinis sp.]|uniref:phosphoribosyltransferase n=1 Tax=Actinocrinis sp. TaxID=1920516 RepID=UPI002D5A5E3D|nr:phosphoribosyltransferase [Actinocrinis sp.]HZP51312.1 phosphoribosyltransferase [Actinocrinis sp.]
MFFVDRQDAGEQLAARLEYLHGPDAVVVGLPRGGVPVAAEVAEVLGAPLDVCLVRKVGVPFQPELAMGAIGEDGVRVVHQELVRAARVSEREFAQVEQSERAALERMLRWYRGGRGPLDVRGRTVIVVDDGLATGATAQAACAVLRRRGASRIVLAVPVGAPEAVERLRGFADEVVCARAPRDLSAISLYYARFQPVSDSRVIECLEHAAKRFGDVAAAETAVAGFGGARRAARVPEVEVTLGRVQLPGRLEIPENARGIVVFAHGAGSSHTSPRNRFVAGQLNRARLGTLLFDLLTAQEAADRQAVFDIDLLAERLTHSMRWLREQPGAARLPIGLFGASTGAAAALQAAADPDADVAALVCRGGRPDLAGPYLSAVSAPTLLIVGSHDHAVIDLNRRAQARMRCESRLVLVAGAGHLFEEPHTLGVVARLARGWFAYHLQFGGVERSPADSATLRRARVRA